MAQERENLVARGDLRLASLVNQMGGHDAAGSWNVLLEELGGVAVGGTVGEHTRDEPVAERLGVANR